MELMKPNGGSRVLDVGVTGTLSQGTENYFEHWYPWPSQITALGAEDGSYLEKKYPGLVFVRADAMNIPFPDKSFDIVFSSAMLEHVGSRAHQQQCINEMMRVGRRVFITTPDRLFPVEVHTGIPLLHYLPAEMYRRVLRFFGLNYFAEEKNLNLLAYSDFVQLLSGSSIIVTKKVNSLIAYSPRL